MKHLFQYAALALALLPAPALALSCMPYFVENAYHDAETSPDAYVIVYGRLSFDPANLPHVDWEHQEDTPPDTGFAGHMTGSMLTPEGFSMPFDQEIRINIQCFGPWCGRLVPDIAHLVFLKQTESGFLLETDPCGGFAFPEPSSDMLRSVVSCFHHGPCKPPVRE